MKLQGLDYNKYLKRIYFHFLNSTSDISIWLHQAIKGFQDAKGAAVPNAHLLGIYHRVCKLLYFKIKPVFVFDGGVPALKRKTIVSSAILQNNVFKVLNVKLKGYFLLVYYITKGTQWNKVAVITTSMIYLTVSNSLFVVKCNLTNKKEFMIN